MTIMKILDSLGATHNFATQIMSSLETAGSCLRALPEGGATPWRDLSLQVTGANATTVKSSLFSLVMANTTAALVYVKLYDKATAPTSSDTPVQTIAIQANSTLALSFPVAMAFANGIGLRATTGVADADAGDPGTNGMIVTATYA